MQDDILPEALKIADVIRLNASHSDGAARTPVIKKIRETLEEIEREVPIFLDIQGPKWRLGLFETPFEAHKGSTGHFYLAGSEPPQGGEWSAPFPHPELIQGAKLGQKWLVDDGILVFEVTKINDTFVTLKTITGGIVKQRKGLMPMGLDVKMDPLTPKDLEDIDWGVKHDVDFFAQSFVRSASDLQRMEEVIQAAGGNQPIIAKIEHPNAIKNLDSIVATAWGVMVARGDLGVELGVDKVPSLQKRIIQTARRFLKPVITATQMLESMIEHPMPTRAESSDVANAIWDGTDAVMLSAESASGQYPLESIKWLAKIAMDADSHDSLQLRALQGIVPHSLAGHVDVSIASAACHTAKEIGAKYIMAFTEGGNIVRMLAHSSGDTPIIGATTNPTIARRIKLMRNVKSVLIPRAEHLSQLLKLAIPIITDSFDLDPGDKVVVVVGHPLWVAGTTNTLRVIII
jgi:pyruvate kinase